MTVTAGSVRNGLSPGAIGGITGGVLGSALLVCIAVIFVLLKRKKTVRAAPSMEIRQNQQVNVSPESDAPMIAETVNVGGRLRYPETH